MSEAALISIEAEQATLGAVLLYGDCFDAVAAVVSSDDFSEALHGEIFEVLTSLHRNGRPTCLVSLHDSMDCNRLLADGKTLREYLAWLCALENVASRADLSSLAAHVRDKAGFRRLMSVLDEAKACIVEAGRFGSPAGFTADLIAQVEAVASRSISPKLRSTSIGNAAREALADAVLACEGGVAQGLRTGLSQLDDMTGGLEPGQVSLLAGRPSMGKSAVALAVAYNIATSGGGVLYVSLEMSGVALARRTLSLITQKMGRGVPYSRIAKGALNARDRELLEQASIQLDKTPLLIEQQPRLNAQQIHSRAMQGQSRMAERGTPLRLIVVDHLGLVAPSGRYSGTRNLELGEISAAIHHMARELDVHVMALSQLSRNVENRDDKRPQLSDLRDSGELEQNADLVISVFREGYYLDRSSDLGDVSLALEVQNDLELGVLKNRAGPTGRVKLWVDMACNYVADAGL